MTIKELAELVARVTSFGGKLVFNTEKPDGTPVKRLDVSKINRLGWSAGIEIEDGVRAVYDWYLKNASQSDRM